MHLKKLTQDIEMIIDFDIRRTSTTTGDRGAEKRKTRGLAPSLGLATLQ